MIFSITILGVAACSDRSRSPKQVSVSVVGLNGTVDLELRINGTQWITVQADAVYTTTVRGGSATEVTIIEEAPFYGCTQLVEMDTASAYNSTVECQGMLPEAELVQDLNTSFIENSSFPQNFTNFADGLLFSLRSAQNNPLQLWYAPLNGAPRRFSEGAPGPERSPIAVVGDSVVFEAYSGTLGQALWEVDATGAAKTLSLFDSSINKAVIEPFKGGVLAALELAGTSNTGLYWVDLASSSVDLIDESDNRIFAIATGSSYAYVDGLLGITDGTSGGTKEFLIDGQPYFETAVAKFWDERLFLFEMYNSSIRQIDPVTSMQVGFFDLTDRRIERVWDVDNQVLLLVSRRNSPPELWKSNGFEAGTSLLTELPAESDVQSAILTGTHFFTVGVSKDRIHSIDLASLELDTAMIGLDAAICATASVLLYQQGTSMWMLEGGLTTRLAMTLKYDNFGCGSLGNDLLFSASDGVTGSELWRFDFIDRSVRQVENLNVGTKTNDSALVFIGQIGDWTYFSARSETDSITFQVDSSDLWRVRNSPSAVERLTSLEDESIETFSHARQSEVLYFSTGGRNGKADGIWAAAESNVLKILTLDEFDRIEYMIAAADDLYLVVENGTNEKLYRITASGNQTLLYNSGASQLEIDSIYPTDSHTYFSVRNVDGSTSLWQSDGTVVGTVELDQVSSELPDNFSVINSVGSTVLLVDLSNENLWSTDGTISNTQLLAASDNGRDGVSFQGQWLTIVNDATNSTATLIDPVTGQHTRLLPSIDQSEGAGLRTFTTAGNYAYFLWRTSDGVQTIQTDGSQAGTRIFSSTVVLGGQPCEANGLLFFEGRSATSSWDFYVSDPNVNSSNAVKFSNSVLGATCDGSTVLLNSSEESVGFELFRIDASDP